MPTSISTSVVDSSHPEAWPAHDSGERFNARIVGDDHNIRIERIGPAIERDEGPRPSCARRTTILPSILFGVEHVQRAGAIEGQVIGDVDKRIDRPQPDRLEPLLHPVGGLCPLRTPRTRRNAKAGARCASAGAEIEPDSTRTRKFAFDRLDGPIFELAEPRRREIAGDAVRRPPHRDG